MGNIAKQEFTIEKIDNKPPQIAYTINKDTVHLGYVTITVTAEDLESGLYDSPFSWDKRIWSKENETRTVKENGRYIVYAEDNLGNVSELEILVDCFPQEGRYELQDGNIITQMTVSAEWEGNTNKNVQITLNKDIDIIGWQITAGSFNPQEFVVVEEEQNRQNEPTPANNNQANVNNNQNNINVSIPSNVVLENITNTENTLNENTTNTTNASQTEQNTQIEIPRRTEPIVLTVSLDINQEYYFWVKERNGNIGFQIFRIYKAQI